MEHLYTMIIGITYNFISRKTSFLRYHKPYLPNIYFAYSSWTSFRDAPLDLEFEIIERFRVVYKPHIFGPR